MSAAEKGTRILGFILQPIVENGILHGVGSRDEGGCLQIEVIAKDKDLFLVVKDNGKGMENPEDLYERPTKGYGIKNVHQRLVLKYGEGDGVSLKSNENGTEVVVHVCKS